MRRRDNQKSCFENIAGGGKTGSKSFLYILGVVAILNVVFAVLLLQWKKLGFFGFVGTSLAAFGMNTYAGISPTQSLFGLIGVGLLYAVYK